MSPFSLLYKWVMQFRNHLYNIENKAIFQFETNVISVGNLAVGGTGKTPMVEYIIRLLLNKGLENKIAVLSRGYGRKTKGFRIASETDTAQTVGDEPYQIYEKFKPKVNVSVGEDRVLAIPSILHEKSDTEVIILDDAFQHRSVKPDFSIVLSDYQHPFYEDYVLPAGRLRESRQGVSRADVLVITKCPSDLAEKEKEKIRNSASIYFGEKPIFFSGISYGKSTSSYLSRSIKKEIVLVTGIAHPEPLTEFLSEQYYIVKHFNFNDHHHYTANEISEIASFAEKNKADVLTTEKDWVKLSRHEAFESALKEKLFYIPMMVQFLENEKSFVQMIEDSLKDH